MPHGAPRVASNFLKDSSEVVSELRAVFVPVRHLVKKLSDPTLDRPNRLKASIDNPALYWLAFKRVLKRSFGLDKSSNSLLESGFSSSVRPQAIQIRLQAVFLLSAPIQVGLDSLVKKLVHGAFFDLAESLES